MLSKSAGELPSGDGWQYEPKWDGFRTIVFRDGAKVLLQSREGKPLNRYFPDLVAPLEKARPARCVLDGEIVIAGRGGLDFEALLLRIHPASSRVALLAKESPASLVVWDLLALGGADLRARPLAARRTRLERALEKATPPVHLSPATRDRAIAADWFRRFEGAGLDGVVAKRLDGAYEAGVRAMVKIKHVRTADCVVAGFRWHKGGAGARVGSLLLGLYDDAGVLHHVGVASAFPATMRATLERDLAPLRREAARDHPWLGKEAGGAQRVPGRESRWSRGKDLSFEPLRPERVCEVAFDHMQGPRFRHAAVFLRFRPDKSPAACRYDQLEVTPPYELDRIFRARTAPRRKP
jgi:ATP-dependent DNA ligase